MIDFCHNIAYVVFGGLGTLSRWPHGLTRALKSLPSCICYWSMFHIFCQKWWQPLLTIASGTIANGSWSLLGLVGAQPFHTFSRAIRMIFHCEQPWDDGALGLQWLGSYPWTLVTIRGGDHWVFWVLCVNLQDSKLRNVLSLRL